MSSLSGEAPPLGGHPSPTVEMSGGEGGYFQWDPFVGVAYQGNSVPRAEPFAHPAAKASAGVDRAPFTVYLRELFQAQSAELTKFDAIAAADTLFIHHRPVARRKQHVHAMFGHELHPQAAAAAAVADCVKPVQHGRFEPCPD